MSLQPYDLTLQMIKYDLPNWLAVFGLSLSCPQAFVLVSGNQANAFQQPRRSTIMTEKSVMIVTTVHKNASQSIISIMRGLFENALSTLQFVFLDPPMFLLGSITVLMYINDSRQLTKRTFSNSIQIKEAL